jgi:cold shock CspA family protein
MRDKGFGFIKGADGKDYFFHSSQCPDWYDIIDNQGIELEFQATSGPKGLRAVDVRRADSA